MNLLQAIEPLGASRLSPLISHFHSCEEELTGAIDRALERFSQNPEKTTEYLKNLVSLREDIRSSHSALCFQL